MNDGIDLVAKWDRRAFERRLRWFWPERLEMVVRGDESDTVRE